MISLHCWSRECAPSWRRSLCLLLSRPRAGRYRQPPATRHTVRLEHETLDIKTEWLHHLHTNVLICFFYNLLIVFLSSPPVRSSCSTSTTLWNLYYYYLSCVFLPPPSVQLSHFDATLYCPAVCLYPFLTFQVTVRWFSPLLLGLMIKSPWSRVSIIFSAWLKLILWKLGWAITRFIYAGEKKGNAKNRQIL